MTDRRLTLMAVHAHPDDEASSTGGVLAKAAAEGIRTVLVTCTDGRCGDGPGGVKPGEPGHDPEAVVELRRGELEKSCAVLGVDHLELLEYADSGMMGWPQNDEPGSFWNTPVSEAAARLAELMRRYEPDVVVSYDDNGFYGHPDHIQAHRITMAAVAETGLPAKVYWTTAPQSGMREMRRIMLELGADWDEPDDETPEIGLPDEQITTWVDTSAFSEQKYDSLAAHASQEESIFFLQMGKDKFTELMGVETFVRVHDTTGAPLPEDDLFAGLR
ncbi:MAG TPA: PIG-L family deacetylase [Jatrophihabitans sp.]|jgi:LmbE family N-acetylglucosaminyl deacetylase|uniref:PIG-L family deacetylase n=1 Tax=Jatrophihabitans sp. TaxID=1932789 RepID=UPI002F15EC75